MAITMNIKKGGRFRSWLHVNSDGGTFIIPKGLRIEYIYLSLKDDILPSVDNPTFGFQLKYGTEDLTALIDFAGNSGSVIEIAPSLTLFSLTNDTEITVRNDAEPDVGEPVDPANLDLIIGFETVL